MNQRLASVCQRGGLRVRPWSRARGRWCGRSGWARWPPLLSSHHRTAISVLQLQAKPGYRHCGKAALTSAVTLWSPVTAVVTSWAQGQGQSSPSAGPALRLSGQDFLPARASPPCSHRSRAAQPTGGPDTCQQRGASGSVGAGAGLGASGRARHKGTGFPCVGVSNHRLTSPLFGPLPASGWFP